MDPPGSLMARSQKLHRLSVSCWPGKPEAPQTLLTAIAIATVVVFHRWKDPTANDIIHACFECRRWGN